MLERLRRLFSGDRPWRLEGWDSFSAHAYPIPGRFRTRASAYSAALRELRKIEMLQPTASSGGQGGIQDQVFIVAPDGSRERVWPQV